MKCILFCLILLLTGCENSRSVNKTSIKKNIPDSLLIRWREDTLGCLGFRKDPVLKILFDKYNLKEKTADEIKNILGKPNNQIVAEGYINLTYYWEGVCHNNQIDP